MADPLSIAASVAGLLATTRKIYTTLSGFTASIIGAPECFRTTLATVSQMRSALVEVQRLIDSVATLPAERKALIRLDHIAVTFSHSILTLTELESVVCSLRIPEMTFLTRFRWALREDEKKIANLLPRLESQKSCLVLMISVLQCQSTIQAVQDHDKLQTTVDLLVQQNVDLASRLETFESTLGDEARSVKFLGHESVFESEMVQTSSTGSPGELSSYSPTTNFDTSSSAAARTMGLREFEAVLEASWVYTRVCFNECDMSLSNSTLRSNARTVLSSISLNDVSTVAIFRLPITIDDVTKGGLNSTFGKLLSGKVVPTPQLQYATHRYFSKREPSSVDDRGFWKANNSIPSPEIQGTVKVVVVGDFLTNKTRLILTYLLENKFPDDIWETDISKPTIFDNYAVNVTVGDEAFTLGIFDTCGSEDYDRLRPLSYSEADVAIICGLIGSEASFSNIAEKWVPEIRHYLPRIPIIIVGTKDPMYFREIPRMGSTMTEEEYTPYGEKMAKDLGAVKYMKCNMGSFRGAEAVFDEALIQALRRKDWLKRPWLPKRPRATKTDGD